MTNRLIILITLFIAAWLPRVIALDAFVTIDERKWLARSANFYHAISEGDLANTFQREHPGVTVMWAGTLGFLQKFPEYIAQTPGQFTWEREHIEAWLLANTEFTPLELLAAGRWWVVLFISLVVTASYFPLRRLFNNQIALWTTLFVAWTPFYIAFSRQLHPDGLSSSLIFLALLLFFGWLYGGEYLTAKSAEDAEGEKEEGRRGWGYLVLSGVVMGLAWLTKVPAMFLVPTGLVLLLIEWRAGRIQFRTSLFAYVTWGLVAIATFVVLWPSMWLDPIGTLMRMSVEMQDYVGRHVNPNYFMGQVTSDPGIIFYPVAYLWRITPATVIGLLLAGVFAWRQRTPFDQRQTRRVVYALLIFALLFTVGMSIAAKKFDRYLLPAALSLDIIAVLGWVALAKNMPIFIPSRKHVQVPAILLASTLFLHGLPGFIHYPYYLTYYNPLVGGSWTAPNVLFTGWGDGLDAAADWLNGQENGDQLRVVSWYADGPLSYFLDGQAVNIGYGSPLFWLDTDFAVVYINQLQRNIPSPEIVDYFQAQTPTHQVQFRGLTLASIYDMRDQILPSFIDIGKESAIDFGTAATGPQIRLSAYDVPQHQALPGDRFQITYYLQSRAQMETNYNILTRLVARDGTEIWRAEGWPWGAPTVDWPLREIRPDGHEIVIPSDAPDGLYQLVVSFYDPATFDALPMSDPYTGEAIDGVDRAVALIRVGDESTSTSPVEQPWNFNQLLTLSGVGLPETIGAGEMLILQLQWDTLARIPVDYTTFVHIVDSSGNLVAQRDQQPREGFAATHLWVPGQTVMDTVGVVLPTELGAGDYVVRIGLYTLDTGRLPVLIDGGVIGDFADVGIFTVE